MKRNVYNVLREPFGLDDGCDVLLNAHGAEHGSLKAFPHSELLLLGSVVSVPLPLTAARMCVALGHAGRCGGEVAFH